MKILTKQQQRFRRHARSRARMLGTAQLPRMCVYRSLRGMYMQLVDDTSGVTIVSAHNKTDFDSTVDTKGKTGKVAIAYVLGYKLGQKAKEKGIERVVFDRSGFVYQGRIAAAAEGARDAGLSF